MNYFKNLFKKNENPQPVMREQVNPKSDPFNYREDREVKNAYPHQKRFGQQQDDQMEMGKKVKPDGMKAEKNQNPQRKTDIFRDDLESTREIQRKNVNQRGKDIGMKNRYEKVEKNRKSVQVSQLNENAQNFIQEIENDEKIIQGDLKGLGERNFPNPYPVKPSFPDSFPNNLIMYPISNDVAEKMVNHANSRLKSREEQRMQFLNFKQETDFYKRFIPMNEIKKQKLLKDIDDIKQRSMIGGQSMYQEPEVHREPVRILQNQEIIEHSNPEYSRVLDYNQNQNTSYLNQNALPDNTSYLQPQQNIFQENINPTEQYKPIQHVQAQTTNQYEYYEPSQNESYYQPNKNVLNDNIFQPTQAKVQNHNPLNSDPYAHYNNPGQNQNQLNISNQFKDHQFQPYLSPNQSQNLQPVQKVIRRSNKSDINNPLLNKV